MRHTLALALVLAGTALAAQNVTGGVYTGISSGLGDLKDKSDLGTNQFFGAHVGGHLDFTLNAKHEVRAHLTLQHLPGTGWGGFADPKNDYKAFQAGADWIFHFHGPRTGWYSIAGASVNSIKDEWEYTNGGGFRVSGTDSQSGKLGVRGGAGYNFTPLFSVEATLNQIFVDKGGNEGFGFDTATWVQVSAVWRFGR